MKNERFGSKKEVVVRKITMCLSAFKNDEIKCLSAQGYEITKVSEPLMNAFAANAPCVIVGEKIVSSDF